MSQQQQQLTEQQEWEETHANTHNPVLPESTYFNHEQEPTMPRINEMLPSKYLKKEDCEPPLLLTITSIDQEQVGQGDDIEDKWICHFEEAKGMVLNSTNMRLLEMITGSDESDDWIGKKVVAYSDPNISFGGKLVGGIRLRAPKAAKVAPPKNSHQPGKAKGDPRPSEPLPAEANADDDIPF